MIETPRLTLRPWRQDDIEPFYAMSQDREVMRFLGPAMTREASAAAVQRMIDRQAATGYCFWAVDQRSDGRFIGFCGLLPAKSPIEGEIEIGWRLARDAWGQGLAREAAQASLAWAWRSLDVPSIAAVTVAGNERSWRLMERIGMHRVVGGDFDHPDLAPGDPLRRHILYRIARPSS